MIGVARCISCEIPGPGGRTISNGKGRSAGADCAALEAAFKAAFEATYAELLVCSGHSDSTSMGAETRLFRQLEEAGERTRFWFFG